MTTPARPSTQRAPTGATPSSSSTRPSSSGARPSSSSASARRQPSARRSLRASGSHRQASSMALMQQKLAEMGSYAKYYKAITQNPFQVKIRCNCGRSRNMAWMFLCTWCATGTQVEKEKESTNAIPYSKLQREQDEENRKKSQSDDNDESKKEENDDNQIQRAFLSCDLCATKMTESYYCPHCLAAYPAHYVKLHTRCTRCVSCPVCTSPLEKIVYSGSNTSSSSSSAEKKDGGSSSRKKDVYLYQCPFCFWSSNIVGLEASESEALLENLKEKLKRPVDEKTVIMNDVKNKYVNINEHLRKEEDRIEKSKRFHPYKGGRSLFMSSNKEDDSKQDTKSPYKRGHKSRGKSLMKLKGLSSLGLGGNGDNMHELEIQQLSALEKIEKSQIEKLKKYHKLPANVENNEIKHADHRYISQFHLRHVSPLQHRLSDPLNQSTEMDKYVPQRFHLMTKESYKCPIKECGKYVCKPTLRGRQANYDKRTAVLDYLPRINIKLKSGNLMTTTKSEIVVMVQNRHLHEAQFRFDADINENDLYSTAKIACSNEWYEIDPADIHIKGGKQKDVNKLNGDYVKGKEAGIIFNVTPKHYSTGPRNIKFSVKCIFKTKLQLKDDKTDSNNKSNDDKHRKNKDKDKKDDDKNKKSDKLMNVELPYILDFDLGPPKTPEINHDVAASSSSTSKISDKSNENKNDENNTNKDMEDKSVPQHKARNSNEAVIPPST